MITRRSDKYVIDEIEKIESQQTKKKIKRIKRKLTSQPQSMAERKPLAHPVPSGQNGCKSALYLFDVGDQEVGQEDIER